MLIIYFKRNLILTLRSGEVYASSDGARERNCLQFMQQGQEKVTFEKETGEQSTDSMIQNLLLRQKNVLKSINVGQHVSSA